MSSDYVQNVLSIARFIDLFVILLFVRDEYILCVILHSLSLYFKNKSNRVRTIDAFSCVLLA